jgi:hypothetical protein
MPLELVMLLKHLHRVHLKKNNGPMALLEFKDSESAVEIDMTIRNVLSIGKNKRYTA